MTVEIIIGVTNKQGVHARPSSMIVRCAMEYDADVVIKNEGTGFEANAKSPLEVMMLNAPCGTKLMIRATGPDAEAAVDAIRELIAAGFNEDDK